MRSDRQPVRNTGDPRSRRQVDTTELRGLAQDVSALSRPVVHGPYAQIRVSSMGTEITTPGLPFWAKITGSSSGNYSWYELWDDGAGNLAQLHNGRSGTTSLNQAREVHGRTDVPTNEIVKMWLCYDRLHYLFWYLPSTIGGTIIFNGPSTITFNSNVTLDINSTNVTVNNATWIFNNTTTLDIYSPTINIGSTTNNYSVTVNFTDGTFIFPQYVDATGWVAFLVIPWSNPADPSVQPSHNPGKPGVLLCWGPLLYQWYQPSGSPPPTPVPLPYVPAKPSTLPSPLSPPPLPPRATFYDPITMQLDLTEHLTADLTNKYFAFNTPGGPSGPNGLEVRPNLPTDVPFKVTGKDSSQTADLEQIDQYPGGPNVWSIDKSGSKISTTKDATTNTVTKVFEWIKNTPNTPTANFGLKFVTSLQSNTTPGRPVWNKQFLWVDPTDATYKPRVLEFITDATSDREFFRVESDGTKPIWAFGGPALSLTFGVVYQPANNYVPLYIQASGSPSVNLFGVTNSSGTPEVYVDKNFKLVTTASTTGTAAVNIVSGVDPSSPTDGDLWYDSVHLYFRKGGTSIDLLTGGTTTSPGGANTDLQYNDSGAFGGDANLTWNKGTETLTVTDSATSGTTTVTGGQVIANKNHLGVGGQISTIGPAGELDINSGGALEIYSSSAYQLRAPAGVKLGSTSADLVSLWGATPIAQPNTTGTSVLTAAGTGTALKQDSTSTGGVGSTAYTLSDVIAMLKNAGVIKS